MTAAAVLEAKVDIAAENMLLIMVSEEKLDSSGNWMTPREHCDMVFLTFFFNTGVRDHNRRPLGGIHFLFVKRHSS